MGFYVGLCVFLVFYWIYVIICISLFTGTLTERMKMIIVFFVVFRGLVWLFLEIARLNRGTARG